MAHSLRFLARRTLLSAADHVVTNPLIRWTWTGPSNDDLMGALAEFRPTDRETILEMMQGRYLLASKTQYLPKVSRFCNKARVRATGEKRWATIGERERQLPLAWAPFQP